MSQPRFQRNKRTFGGKQSRGMSAGQVIADNPRNPVIGTGGNEFEVIQTASEVPFAASLSFTITTSGTYDTTSDIPFIPKDEDATLPAQVTFGNSNFASFAAYAGYYGKEPVMLGNLKVSASASSVFDYKLKIIEAGPDGVDRATTRSWNELSKNPANYDQTWREFPGLTFISGKQSTQYWLDGMPISSTMTFYFDILGTNKVVNIGA